MILTLYLKYLLKRFSIKAKNSSILKLNKMIESREIITRKWSMQNGCVADMWEGEKIYILTYIRCYGYSELIRESGIRLQPDAAGYDIGPGLSGWASRVWREWPRALSFFHNFPIVSEL